MISSVKVSSLNPNPPKILFLVGSINQTTQMHKISEQLPDMDCWFSQTYSDSRLSRILLKYTSVLDNTILGGQFKRNTDQYLLDHGLKVDYEARKNQYDLVFFCTDMILPGKLLKSKTIWVQEGMTDPLSWKSEWVKKLKLPLWFTDDTSLNGTSNLCDLFLVASEGYKSHFSFLGTDPKKIIITGIPNYDHIDQFRNNDFPYKDYVMVATSDLRETRRNDNRIDFIRRCKEIAGNRRLLFKLHPNEDFERAIREIKMNTPPDTLIFQKGNTNEMIANSVELITQYSTVVYVGMALGIPVHSYFDLKELKALCPIQNQGTSASNIARIARDFIQFEGEKSVFKDQYHFEPESLFQPVPDLNFE